MIAHPESLYVSELSQSQADELEERLFEYEFPVVGEEPEDGVVNIGYFRKGQLVAGVVASMWDYGMLYVSTLFVDEDYRGRGLGRQLLAETKKRALELDAKYLLLDTISEEAAEFYRKLGYEQVGQFESTDKKFTKYTFLDRLSM